MTSSLWISYLLASLIIIANPGPSITLLIMTSISLGKREAIFMNFGIILGNFITMFLSFAGIGAILRAFPIVYNILRIGGAIYLVYLGLKTWWDTREKPSQTNQEISKKPTFQAFWVTVLNPRSFFFFISFMPQFVNNNEPYVPQILVLGASFLILVLLTGIVYIITANGVSRFLKNNHQMWIQRIGALNLIITGIGIFVLKR